MKTNVKMMTKLLLLILVTGSLFTACKKDAEDNDAKVAVKLTDDPFPYNFVAEANVDFTKIELKNENGDYVTVYSGSHTENVAAYTNGATANVTVAAVSPGTYTDVRVTIGGVTVKLTNNETYSVDAATSFETEVPIYPEITVSEGDEANLLFDMDLSDSIQFSGGFFGDWISDIMQISGIQSFDPDIRAVVVEHTGSISGQVIDDNGDAVAYAEVKVKYDYDADGNDEDVTTIADANGQYKIIGLPAGTYKVEVDTENNGDVDVDNVSVSVKQETTVNVTVN